MAVNVFKLLGGGQYQIPITPRQNVSIIGGGVFRNGNTITISVRFKCSNTGGANTFLFDVINFNIGDINYPLLLTTAGGIKVDSTTRWYSNSCVCGATITANTEYIVSGSFNLL